MTNQKQNKWSVEISVDTGYRYEINYVAICLNDTKICYIIQIGHTVDVDEARRNITQLWFRLQFQWNLIFGRSFVRIPAIETFENTQQDLNKRVSLVFSYYSQWKQKSQLWIQLLCAEKRPMKHWILGQNTRQWITSNMQSLNTSNSRARARANCYFNSKRKHRHNDVIHLRVLQKQNMILEIDLHHSPDCSSYANYKIISEYSIMT